MCCRAIAIVLALWTVVPGAKAETDSTALDSAAAPNSAHLPPDPMSGLPDTTAIRPTRLAIVGGSLLAVMTAIHIYQMNGWWKDNRTSFHFQEDLKYGLSVDKWGHFYGGAAAAFVYRNSFAWAGFSEEAALWWGSAASLLFQTYVEVEDGFSTWGFDRVDFAADVAGAAWPIAQHYAPILRNVDFKFSYHPSPELNAAGGSGFRGQKHILFDDYEGQTLWIGLRVHNLLPESARPYWPSWLGVAFGYGARDVLTAHPYRVYFIGLDLDMTRIIPDDTAFLRMLGEAMNFIRLPLPAVRISPGAIWYGVYF